jgi:Arc/MetJ-type ribon-helix-helix transcriptional regulator
MTIHLSGQREQIVLSLLEAGEFSSADEVIDEALRLVGERCRQANDRTIQQLENLRQLGRKLDAMPVVAVTDRFTNRDHDQIVYGK